MTIQLTFNEHILAKTIFVLVIFVIGILAARDFPPKGNDGASRESFLGNLKGDEASATPSPFEDLTIPYLVSREYKSALGSLGDSFNLAMQRTVDFFKEHLR